MGALLILGMGCDPGADPFIEDHFHDCVYKYAFIPSKIQPDSAPELTSDCSAVSEITSGSAWDSVPSSSGSLLRSVQPASCRKLHHL